MYGSEEGPVPDDKDKLGDKDRSDDKDRIAIIVNGRERIVTSEEISFKEVLELAFNPVPSGPNWEFTVTYRDGAGRPPDGSLRPGGEVKVKDGTVFNATATDKS